MVFPASRPDPLIDPLPDPMRAGYRAAECALLIADNVKLMDHPAIACSSP
jgi:hypothetical protein